MSTGAVLTTGLVLCKASNWNWERVFIVTKSVANCVEVGLCYYVLFVWSSYGALCVHACVRVRVCVYT